MDWLTFLAEIIKAAVWPIFLAICVILLKDQLKALLNKITELLPDLKGKAGSVEWEFKKKSEALVKVVEMEGSLTMGDKYISTQTGGVGPTATAQPSTTPDPAYPMQFFREADQAMKAAEWISELQTKSPEEAVMNGWKALEEALLDAGERLGLPRSKHHTAEQVAGMIQNKEWMTDTQYRLILSLRDMKNIAAHPGRKRTIDPVDATKFLAVIPSLVSYLQELTKDSPKVPKAGT